MGLTERTVRAGLAVGILTAVIYLAIVGHSEAAVGALVTSLVLVRDYFMASKE